MAPALLVVLLFVVEALQVMHGSPVIPVTVLLGLVGLVFVVTMWRRCL